MQVPHWVNAAYRVTNFMKFRITQRNFIWNTSTELYSNRTKNVENRAKFYLRPSVNCGFNSTEFQETPSLKFASRCIIIQIKYINQLDATTSQVYYLTFMYSSTCFGHPHVHHQELDCSSSLWFYRWSVVVAVLLVVVGPVLTGPTMTNRGCYCSCWAPDDGHKDTQNTLSWT
jgi:hypothetical protein